MAQPPFEFVPQSMSDELDLTLRLAGIALGFVSEPETIRVFTQWANKEHAASKENGVCHDEDCIYNTPVEEWLARLHKALNHIVRILAANAEIFNMN